MENDELYVALAKAEAEFTPIEKNCEAVISATRKYQYADLSSIYKSVKPALAKYGMIVTSSIHKESPDHNAILVTKIVHIKSRQNLVSMYPLKEGGTEQNMGSSITYGRRYNITNLLDLVTDEDDDGASSPALTRTTPSRPHRPTTHHGDGKPSEYVLPFGKYKGLTLLGVYAADEPYLQWLAENAKEGELREMAQAVLNQNGPLSEEIPF